MRRRPGPLWGILAFVAIASSMLSLPSLNLAITNPNVICSNSSCVTRGNPVYNCSNGGTSIQTPLNCSDVCTNASSGTECAIAANNLCIHALCNGTNCSIVEGYVPASCNDDNPCTIDQCDTCGNNCSGSCVNTPSNSSSCNLPQGDPCFANGQCTTTFCVDGVCCDTSCTDPLHDCNVPGSVGHCIPHAPAPVVSRHGIVVAVLLLALVGGLSLRRALRAPRH